MVLQNVAVVRDARRGTERLAKNSRRLFYDRCERDHVDDPPKVMRDGVFERER